MVPGEVFQRPPPCGSSHIFAERIVFKEFEHAFSQRSGIIFLDQKPGLAISYGFDYRA